MGKIFGDSRKRGGKKETGGEMKTSVEISPKPPFTRRWQANV